MNCNHTGEKYEVWLPYTSKVSGPGRQLVKFCTECGEQVEVIKSVYPMEKQVRKHAKRKRRPWKIGGRTTYGQ